MRSDETVATVDEKTAIHPFRIDISQVELDDLRERLRRTRWAPDIGDASWERGVPLGYLKGLAEYWAEGFDWRRHEVALNEVPQFVTAIDGQEMHFLHARSREPDALPLILIHGWPSSFVEFLQIIGPLTDPRSHGRDPGDAFHLVIPSLPGYGFSTPVREPGWGNLFRVALAWIELMSRLGYERYGVHGTDAGSGVAAMLAMLDAARVTGTHVAGTVAAMPFGPPVDLEGLSASDRARAERFNSYQADGLGYLHMQATRPQTLAYSLTDSPVGQLAWIVEKFQEWTDPSASVPEEAVDRDQLLVNASVFWFTCAGAFSAHMTYDGMKAWREMEARESQPDASDSNAQAAPPTAVAVFAADTAIRSVMDPAGEIERWTEFERGGHFPAMETPGLLAEDLCAFFRAHRQAGS